MTILDNSELEKPVIETMLMSFDFCTTTDEATIAYEHNCRALMLKERANNLGYDLTMKKLLNPTKK